jgi:predicted dithiol-disulfide oxidoreductase (DUF899 family)
VTTEGLWPVEASAAYRTARQRLDAAELRLRGEVEAVAAQRRDLAALGTPVRSYVLLEADPDPCVTDGPTHERGLADLLGPHRSLVVYHLMYGPGDAEACPMCSMWIDGLAGAAPHLRQRVGLTVVAPAPLPQLRAWACARGWSGLRVLSAAGTTFSRDFGAEDADGTLHPAVSVFSRGADGQLVHVYTRTAGFADGTDRGLDLLSPVWNVLDLVPEGRGDWYPQNAYPDESLR